MVQETSTRMRSWRIAQRDVPRLGRRTDIDLALLDSPVRQVAVPSTDENDLALVLLWIRSRCASQRLRLVELFCASLNNVRWELACGLNFALVGPELFWMFEDRRLALRGHLRPGDMRSRPPNGSAELRHPLAFAISIGDGPRGSGFNSSLSSSLPSRPA